LLGVKIRVKAQCPGEQLIKVAREFRKSVASVNMHARTHGLLHRWVRVKEKRSILHTVLRRKAGWIGHTMRRNCFLEHYRRKDKRNKKRLREDEEEDVSSYWMNLSK
jgi:hypothetical protein